MSRWIKRQSLVLSCSIVLSILLIAVVSVISLVTYNSTVNEVYRKFNDVGNKLRDVAQANVNLIEKTAPAMIAGQKPPEEQMSLMKMLLSGTTDDYLVENAYYLLAEYRQEGDKHYYRYLQASESLKKLDIEAGSEYEDHGSFSQAYAKALGGEAGLTDVFADEYGEWLTYLGPIKDANDKVVGVYGIDFNYHLVQQRMTELIWKTIGLSAGAILISILVVVVLLLTALKPLQLMAARAKEAAMGDLTVHVPITTENEIGQAGIAFNEMITNLRELAIQIGETSSEVASSSLHLKETASQAEAATNEIAHSISLVAVGAESQLISSNECQRAMTEMAIGIQRIAESSSVVSELAMDTADLAVNGEGVMEHTVKQMGTIEEHVGSATDAMRELNESSKRIVDILAHIADIANQTNLLALNASIEAARAGEHGKGFAVVAQEIRKLAERSKTSSGEISTILSEIGERSQTVARSLTVSVEEAREGTKLANASGESFRSILESVKQVSSQVQEVSAAAEQMSAGSEEIAASLEGLESTAQLSAANAQEVAAASEEQLASVEGVAGASQQLNILATQLNGAVMRFKV
ncbi:methyl-accepting chemotaxis protein [Paenibacillus sp. N1-5-1-14]|uniref:methyl-accepting chemotaxis protein n=1 Tax=Paenibacillus radicibacter TaxID=2972488 RepID=UPI002159A850|nr:methyl-accepting chemotaxis protein [Paenibacillus radicibacter]MCR8642436.1 methyl-accepting chemotaxis protein [Paenibacillus radicibacter]